MMDKTKTSFIVLIVILAVLALAAAYSMGWFSKADTKLNVLTKDSLSSDEQIKVKLLTKDKKLASKTVYFKFTDEKGNVKDYSVKTKEQGLAELDLKDLDSGNYTVNVTFEGDDKYNPASTSQKLEIKEPVVEEEPVYEEPAVSSGSSSSSSDDGYWETSMDADFEYHTEYEPDGEFRQYDRSGRLVGSSHDEDQVEVANNVGWRI